MAIHRAKVENGILEGVPGGNPLVTVFKGIPYAAPPVGELRWRAPQPPGNWEGVRQAYTFGRICPQPTAEGAMGKDNPKPFEPIDEDCLYLNVWTPADSPDERLPVLFWIHGGANVAGYGHMSCLDGEGLAKRGIILVTFSWRVNIFGWLVHPELSAESPQHISGNYGVLDQIAALNWVRKNIAAFGGDPGNITVAGESAGASSTQLICTTPLTKGMVKRGIMQSGGGFSLFSSHDFLTLEEAEKAVDLERALGVGTIADARKLSAEEIVERIFRPEARGAYLPMPVADGYVFPKTLPELIQAGEYHHIQYMIGCTADETAMYIYPEDKQIFIDSQKAEYGEHAEAYLKLCDFMEDDEQFKKHLKYRNAEVLKTGMVVWNDMLERHGDLPCYTYCFARKAPGDDLGAFHSCELAYLFETLDRSWRPYDGDDYNLSKTMVSYWSNFIKYGDPNGEGLTVWRPYTGQQPDMLVLDKEIRMERLEANPRMIFRRNFVLGEMKRCGNGSSDCYSGCQVEEEDGDTVSKSSL